MYLSLSLRGSSVKAGTIQRILTCIYIYISFVHALICIIIGYIRDYCAAVRPPAAGGRARASEPGGVQQLLAPAWPVAPGDGLRGRGRPRQAE